jgi:uncharacterized protein with PQ loop repeat
MIEPFEICGYIGTTSISCLYLPEIYKTIKEKKVNIGWGMLGLQHISSISYFVYSMHLESVPLLITNTFTMTSAIILTYYKLREKKEQEEENPLLV